MADIVITAPAPTLPYPTGGGGGAGADYADTQGAGVPVPLGAITSTGALSAWIDQAIARATGGKPAPPPPAPPPVTDIVTVTAGGEVKPVTGLVRPGVPTWSAPPPLDAPGMVPVPRNPKPPPPKDAGGMVKPKPKTPIKLPTPGVGGWIAPGEIPLYSATEVATETTGVDRLLAGLMVAGAGALDALLFAITPTEISPEGTPYGYSDLAGFGSGRPNAVGLPEFTPLPVGLDALNTLTFEGYSSADQSVSITGSNRAADTALAGAALASLVPTFTFGTAPGSIGAPHAIPTPAALKPVASPISGGRGVGGSRPIAEPIGSPIGMPIPGLPPLPIGRPRPMNPTPAPRTQTQSSCNCSSENKSKDKQKKKPRDVCYRGTYYELANGLRKTRKEKIPCR